MTDVTAQRIVDQPHRDMAVRSLDVPESPAQPDFDDIVKLASDACSTPIALLTLMDADRRWIKARAGLDLGRIGQAVSLCAAAIQHDEMVEVPDVRLDPRYVENPLAVGPPFIRFFAGAAMMTTEGDRIGTLCVVDHRPRRLTDQQHEALRALARHAVTRVELREYMQRVDRINVELDVAHQAKDRFLARVSHELRTPLAAIQGYLEIINDGDLDGERTRRFLATMDRNCQRLGTLVEDLLVAADLDGRRVVAQQQVVDLSALVRELGAGAVALAECRGLTVAIDTPVEVFAHADARRLGQAIDRLILNAIKFTSSGGILLRTAVRDGRPSIQVIDTGIGIPVEEQGRLFERFYRAANAEALETPGAGLGLSIVKAVVDAHAGTVEVVSAVGAGTTVTVTLSPPEPVQA